MADAVVPVAAESAGAVVVVAAESWLVVGLESQLASSKLVLRPVAKSARRWEMDMKDKKVVQHIRWPTGSGQRTLSTVFLVAGIEPGEQATC
jgi:hypothetical protein